MVKCLRQSNGHMVGIQRDYRSQVDRCYQLALVAGGADEGSSGTEAGISSELLWCLLRDLDGNKVCVCCHEPE